MIHTPRVRRTSARGYRKRNATGLIHMRHVYLAQVNWSNCAGNTPGYWIPYSVGSLWAYCNAIPQIHDHFVLRDILFSRVPLLAALERIDQPDVVGFSTYVWNEKYNLALAKAIKGQWPNALIVLGGPQVPNHSDGFFERYPFVDLLVHSEGEHIFANVLLERLKVTPQYTSIKGCSVNVEGRTVKTAPASRIRDLGALPSPYITGVFDSLLASTPNAEWNAVIETNRGCPYRCTFCDWGTLTYSKVTRFTLDRVFTEVEWLARNQISYVLPADANFGIFHERDDLIVDAFIAQKRAYGFPTSVGMNFAKNSNMHIVGMAERLHQARLLKALTVSTQSMSAAVLAAIERKNMRINDMSQILEECNRRDVPTYTELILGLPRETYTSWKEGLCTALECGQHNQLESWLLELLPNAPLSEPKVLHEFGVKSAKLRNYCFVFDQQERDEVPEEIDIVYETNSMPFADFQKALGFSMIIYNLHAYGWTQCLSRLLRATATIGYLEFYTKLEAWIEGHPDTLLFSEYSRTVNAFRQMVETGDYIVDRYLGSVNVGSVPLGLRSQGYFHLQSERTHREIESFIEDEFKGLLGPLAEEALLFQRHFVTSPSRRYPYSMAFSADVLSLISDNLPLASPAYEFSSTYPFSNTADYLAKIYSRKKQGFGKAVVKKIACQPNVSQRFEKNIELGMVETSGGDNE